MRLNVIQNPADAPWYSKGLEFTCTQCGNCCTGGPGFVWISHAEIERLAEYLKMTPPQVVEKYCRKLGGRFSLNEKRIGSRYDCIFLEEVPVPAKSGNKTSVVQTRRICAIYPVRPLQCRTWPFWPENLESPEAWKASSARCPGMDAGKRHFTIEQIEKYRDASDWPENPPSSTSKSK